MQDYVKGQGFWAGFGYSNPQGWNFVMPFCFNLLYSWDFTKINDAFLIDSKHVNVE